MKTVKWIICKQEKNRIVYLSYKTALTIKWTTKLDRAVQYENKYPPAMKYLQENSRNIFWWAEVTWTPKIKHHLKNKRDTWDGI